MYIGIGSDSCAAPLMLKSLHDLDDELFEKNKSYIDCCESSLFSSYINCKGEYWHCSFSENEDGVEPVNVLEVDDFLKDVWYSEPVKKFRERVLNTEVNGCRQCVTFPEINIDRGD